MKLLKWLSVADRFAKVYLDKLLVPFGINSSQHMFLIKICSHPGILQDSLMDTFYIHPSNIVRTIAALEKNGFIIRTPYEKDKRTWQLYPTDKAVAAVGGIQAACERTESILLQELSEEERILVGEALEAAGRRITKELGIEREEDEFDG